MQTTEELSEYALREFEKYAGNQLPGSEKYFVPRVTTVYTRKPGTVQFSRIGERQNLSEFLGADHEHPGRDALHAQPPFMALLVGRYGVGKTESVLRFSQRLEKQAQQKGARRSHPVPINLARCRGKGNLLSNIPRTIDFTEFLLSGLEIENESTMIPIFQSAVQTGEIFLLLDGLDEVIDNDNQHLHFFMALATLLSPGGSSGARTVVTARQEYLSLYDPDCKVLLRYFRLSSAAPNVYSLELQTFNDAEFEDYLERRLGPELSRSLLRRFNTQEKRDLRTILCRPLHLRVFADSCESPEGVDELLEATAEKGGSLSKPKGTAGLFNFYINQVTKQALDQQRLLGAHYGWNNELLAIETKNVFSVDEDFLRSKNIEKIRTPLCEEEADVDEPPMLAIHKCPFLIQENRDRARFSQKAFYEFFTVKGIVMEFEDFGKDVRQATAFNTLVVNSDMRKFLRGMVDDFDSLIRFSCGLENPEYWGESARFEDRVEWLDEILVSITWGMTDPEIESSKIEENIHKLLSIDLSEFDPGYLRYCFQAVATYLVYDGRRNRHAWQEGWARFSQKMHDSLKRAIDELAADKGPVFMQERWQLLVERCFYLCIKFNLEWGRYYLEDVERLTRQDWESASKKRVGDLIHTIRRRF